MESPIGRVNRRRRVQKAYYLRMRRRAVLVTLLLAASAAAEQPNIVLLMADDLGWNDVGYHGSDIATPNIDKLAAEGLELDRYYAFPFCTPTRVAIMSGRSPLRFGINGPVFQEGGLPLDETTMGDIFQSAGYQTWWMGKWHIGHEKPGYLPNARGWDHAYGSLTGGLDHFSHNSETFMGAPDWHRNGEPVDEEGHSTDLYTREARGLIKNRDKERPFLLYVGYNAVHTPLQATDEHLAQYEHVEDSHRRTYSAMATHLDSSVGKLIETLKQEGLRNNTLVVWVSDNGGATRAGASNEPLRDQKGSPYEGGIRVPGLVNWPGKIKPGVLSQFVSAHDWVPTFLGAAGLDTPAGKALDGHNMWPAISRGETVERGDLVLGSFRGTAVFRGKWKYVVASARGGRRGRRGTRGRGAAATGTGPTPTPALFDILADPGESSDLATDHPDLVSELAVIAAELNPPTAGGSRRGRGRGGNQGFGLPNPDRTYPEDVGPHMLERSAP